MNPRLLLGQELHASASDDLRERLIVGRAEAARRVPEGLELRVSKPLDGAAPGELLQRQNHADL